MKKIFFLFITLFLAHAGFAQLKVNSAGNAGIGAAPDSKAKLLLYNKSAAADSLFGLYSTVNNTNTNLTKPVYGIYSNNTNTSVSSPLYGGYFKNTQTGSQMGGGFPLCGIYLDNNSSTYATLNYGVYSNNAVSGYMNTTYGYYTSNTSGGQSSSVYGFYADNTANSYGASLYGIYLSNSASNSMMGSVYGVYSTNISTMGNSSVYGAYLSATSTTANNTAYGIYSTVSGGNTNNRYAGYFTGGKVVMMNGNVGIGREQPSYLLDVNGTIRVASTLYSSDERLKSDIKPLTDEKDKLYLLQGKSYKKALFPSDIKDSLSLVVAQKAKEKSIEIQEYGYLAQELKDVFPDLVSQDSAGYYSVNYIGLIPVIIEALKDQRSEDEKKQIRIEEQQIQIEKQQVQIDEQREQIKQLVKLMGIKSIDKKAFEENGIESIPMLMQNTPNPFSQATEIGYFIPETVGSANIYIYDVNGVQQKNISIAERGNGVTVLQATSLQAGIYFYTLICDGKPVDTKQMILTR